MSLPLDHSSTMPGIRASLIRGVGFTPIDAGPLRIARYLEPSSLLIAQLAYETGGSPGVVYRVSRIGQPERT
jgi:predicted dinucleotide-binding enzyme